MPSPHTDMLDGASIASTIPTSVLHRAFRDADQYELDHKTLVTKLHVGEPYFTPPAAVAQALAEAVTSRKTDYTEVEGLLELREELVVKLAVQNGIAAEASTVFVTPGSCQGLAALMQAVAQPGAEILLPELHWPIHVQQALLAGLRPVFYPLGPGYQLDPEAVRACATTNTKILLLNSPANPSGAIVDTTALQEMLNIARSHDWQIISDEAYEHFVYDGEHVSTASLERDVPADERIVHSVFTFSKSLAMTGYRLGYLTTANETTARAMRIVQEANLIAMSTPVQYAGLEAIRMESIVSENRAMVMSNRNAELPSLCAAGLLSNLPAGGWYAMLDVKSTGLTAEAFTSRLLRERQVAVVPGAGFALIPRLDTHGRVTSVTSAPWSKHLIRIAFCVDPNALQTGVRELINFANDCRGAM